MRKTITNLLLSALIIIYASGQAAVLNLDPYQTRDNINKKIMAVNAETPAVGHVDNITITHENRQTPLRIYTPMTGNKPLPVILMIHGGAWVAGNLDTHDNMARFFSKEAEALVVSVGYLNAPEGKFPVPLEQCYDALLWIQEHAGKWQGDKNRIAVLGDSAGASMSAALCLLARDRHGPKIDLQVLINPFTDLTGNVLQGEPEAIDTLKWYALQYVQNSNDLLNPYASPLKAQSLSGLPTALVILAEKDALRPDGQKYADRLISSGVRTNIFTQWNVGHLAANGARASKVARESHDVAAAVLRGTFSQF